jgi:hypothetical protein
VEVTLVQDAGLTTYEGSGVTGRNLDFTAASGNFVDTTNNAVSAVNNVTVTYVEDETAPTLVSASWNATTSRFTLEFSEVVDISTMSATGFSFSGLTGYLDPADMETATDSDVVTFQAAVDGARTNSITTAAAELPASTTKIYFTKGAIKDMAGNDIAAVELANAISISYTDATPPTVVGGSATQISTNIIELSFNEKVDQVTAENKDNYAIVKSDNPAITLTPSDVNLQANGTDVWITTVEDVVNGYSYKITVTDVKDLYGNVIVNNGTSNVDTFTATTTTDSTGPSLAASGVVYKDVNSNYTVDSGDTLTLTFSEPIVLGTVVDGDFTVAGFTGAGTYNFGAGATFAKGTTNDTLIITLGSNSKLQTADLGTATINSKATSNIKDLAGNSSIAGVVNTINKPDTTAPTLKAAKYEDANDSGKVDAGDYLYLTYSENLNTSVNLSTLAATDFQYTGGNDTIGTVSAVEYVSTTEVRLTLGGAPELDGGAGTLAYLTATSEIDTAAAPALAPKDMWGNAAVANAMVDIKCDDTTNPVISAAKYTDVNTNSTVDAGDTIELTMSEPVQGTGIANSDFLLSGGATLDDAVTSSTFAVSGNKITITLGSSPAISVDVTTINIKAGGASSIRDAAGNVAQQTVNGVTIND